MTLVCLVICVTSCQAEWLCFDYSAQWSRVVWKVSSTVQCSAVQCSGVQCSAAQCSEVQCSVCSSVQCSAVQYSTVQCSRVQSSVVQWSAVQWSQDHSSYLFVILPVFLVFHFQCGTVKNTDITWIGVYGTLFYTGGSPPDVTSGKLSIGLGTFPDQDIFFMFSKP